ncbi:MAG: rhodanese-like domain-containing protein [Candidatus Hodarchaeales archaeon]
MQWKTGIIIIFIILCISFFSFNNKTISVNAKPVEGYTDVTVSEAHTLIEKTSNLFILDVRTRDEYLAGHINNSHLLPYLEIESNQHKIPQNKSSPLLVYCRSGRRSSIASNTLVELNYTQVFNMHEGFIKWNQANYPYISSNDNSLSISTIIMIVFIIIIIVLVIAGLIIVKQDIKG